MKTLQVIGLSIIMLCSLTIKASQAQSNSGSDISYSSILLGTAHTATCHLVALLGYPYCYLSALTDPKTIKLMHRHASNLIEQYPPDENQLILLGAQNVILSAAIYLAHARSYSSNDFDNYVKIIPVQKLNKYTENNSVEKTTAMFSKILPSAENLSGRRPVVIRVLQSGLTVSNLTTMINNYWKHNNITPRFDYFSGKAALCEQRWLNDADISIQCDSDYASFARYSSSVNQLFQFNRYSPFQAFDVDDETFTIELVEQEQNPYFYQLVEFIRYYLPE